MEGEAEARAGELVDLAIGAVLLEAALSLVLPAILFVLIMGAAWGIGRWIDRRHLAQLDIDEAELRGVTASNCDPDRGNEASPARGVALVTGSVVVANNRFKMWRARWRSLIGGRIVHYETLVFRARREAIVRMKREARELGSDHVCGVRLQSTAVGVNNQPGGVEVVAYGTAIL